MIPVRDGDTYIIVATLYGYSSASWCPALEKKNDKLVSAAVCRASQFLTTPYFLCTDLNQDPQKSHPLVTAVETGILADLAADWSPNQEDVPSLSAARGCTKE